MEGRQRDKYFNFPVTLLDGFLLNHKESLDKIFEYSIYEYSQSLEYGTEQERWKDAKKYFGVNGGSFERGKKLFKQMGENLPQTGISQSIFWDYYKNEKTSFDCTLLLAYLALRSIIGSKLYSRLDNAFLLSRMDGKIRSVENYSELSPEIRKYASDYSIRKIKRELSESWGLKTYSKHTRGFYISFKLELTELIIEAEKRREKAKELFFKQKQNAALKLALERLENLKKQKT